MALPQADTIRQLLEDFAVPTPIVDTVTAAVGSEELHDVRVEGRTLPGQYVSVAAAGQQIALYVDRTGLSISLDREQVARARDQWSDITIQDYSPTQRTAYVRVAAKTVESAEYATVVEHLSVEALRRSAKGHAGRQTTHGKAAHEPPVDVCPTCTMTRAANGSCDCD